MQAILESPVADAAITSAGRGVVLYTVLYIVDLACVHTSCSRLAGCVAAYQGTEMGLRTVARRRM